MTHRKSYNDPGHAHFLTFSCFRNRQFLTDPLICTWLAEFTESARKVEEFDLWAYVFMPEHVHLLIRPRNDDYAISRVLRRIKESLTRRVLKHWGDTAPRKLEQLCSHQGRRAIHRFWQAGGGFDQNLCDMDIVRKAITYIEANPVRRGLVSEPERWRWSSARARAGMGDVPLTIDLVGLMPAPAAGDPTEP
ncbi:MAG TPA: transposase [Acidobacteriota bacterium]|nr:transposase [Acidobacteriota bacterium]